MNQQNKNPYTIEELLGNSFQRIDRRELGAIDSVHEAAFGTYNGQDAVAKPFYSKSAFQKATREARLERLIIKKGMRTTEPITVVQPPQPKTAVLVTKYIPGLIGANTLTLESDPGTNRAVALARPAGSIALLLGRLHGERITHGDPQMKNFGFLATDVSAGITDQPLVFDLESGSLHGAKNRGNEFFENTSRKDLGKLALSLGDKQYGGTDPVTASDFLHETVIKPYAEGSPAGDMITRVAMANAIDFAHSEFTRGRETATVLPGHISKVS